MHRLHPLRVRTRLAARPWAWLLALALVLPLAQLAGAVHLLQHREAVAAGEPAAPAHLPLCDLCLAASTAGGPAALPAVAAPGLSPLAHGQPGFASAPWREGVTALPYRSRAPPFLPA